MRCLLPHLKEQSVRRRPQASRTEPRPLSPAEEGGGSPSPCHPDASKPLPGARPRRKSTPAPSSHLQSRCRAESGPFPPQSRFSIAAAAAAAAATESSIPAGATWNRRASRGARGSRGLQPLGRPARLTPAPSRTELPRDRPPPYKTLPEPPLSAQHPLPRLPPPPPSLPPPPHLSH